MRSRPVSLSGGPRRMSIDHAIRGMLVHSGPGRVPIHDMRVELHLDIGGRRTFLGRSITSANGRFEVRVALTSRVIGGQLVLAVVRLRPQLSPEETLEQRWDLVHEEVSRTLREPADYDFRTIAVNFWEYRETAVARVAPRAGGSGEQTWDVLPERFHRFFQMPSTALNGARRQVLSAESITAARVHQAFPANLTRQLDGAASGRSRTEDFLADRLLNGLYPVTFYRREGDEDGLHLTFSWKGSVVDGVLSIPDVEGRFVPGDDRPSLQRVRIRRRGSDAWATVEASDEGWDNAIAWLRTAWVYQGAVEHHLMRTHLGMEQVSMAVLRNLRASPVADLLAPFVRDVALVNHIAEEAFTGPEAIGREAIGLDLDQLHARAAEVLGSWDWATWHPRAPRFERDAYTRAAAIHWQIAGQVAEEFVQDQERAIAAQWRELRRLSDELVASSPPWRAAEDEGTPWDVGEVGDTTIPREPTDGVLRAMSPLTTSDSPEDGDMGRLVQFIRFVIHQATFEHTWTHERTYEDAGDLGFASFAPGDGDGPAPASGRAALDQIFATAFVRAVNHGRVANDDEGDLPLRYKELVTRAAPAFAAVGFELKTLRSRIVA